MNILISDQLLLRIVIYIFAALSALSLLLVVVTFVTRYIHVRQNRRELERERLFRKILFTYLDNPDGKGVFSKLPRVADRAHFFRYLLNYMEILKGSDREVIRQLMNEMDIAEIIKKYVHHRNRWKRAYGAYALGVLKDEQALPELYRLLEDSFYLTQFCAARSIIQINQKGSIRVAVEKLLTIPSLSSYQVMEGLVELDEEGLEICRQMLQEKPPMAEAKMLLFVELFAYKKYASAAGDILLILQDAKDRELQIACIRALGLLHHTPAVGLLRGFLRSEDWVIKSQAIRTLGRIGDLGSLAEFLEGLKSSNFWIQYNSAQALYDLGSVGHEYLNKIRQDFSHPAREIAEQVWGEKRTYLLQGK